MVSSKVELLIQEASLLLESVSHELEAEAPDLVTLQLSLEQHGQLFQAFFTNLQTPLNEVDKALVRDYLDRVTPVIRVCEQGKESIGKKLGAIRFRERVVKTYQL